MCLFQRIAERQKTATVNHAEIYDDFRWTLAKKFTDSTKDLSVGIQEIFIEIRQYIDNRNELSAADRFAKIENP